MMPIANTEQKNIESDNNSTDKMASEYASVTCAIKDAQVYIETIDIKEGSKDAILKITEKYDSLGKLRASLERLDLNEDDGVATDDGTDKLPLYYSDDEESGISDHSRCYERTNSTDVSDQDLQQVESFFRSHKTLIYVCPTLANLYLSTVESSTLALNGTPKRQQSQSNWQLTHTGIPLLLLDTGETRSRTKRRIQIVLAEKGTGFLLWKDTIDNLSNYEATNGHFHTMYLSIDHRKMIGLSFNSVPAARDFYERIEMLTSDPANISLSGPSSKAAKKMAAKLKKMNVKKVKLPRKTDISQPCCFQHVTKVDLGDKEQFVTLSTLTGSYCRQQEVTSSTTTSLSASNLNIN